MEERYTDEQILQEVHKVLSNPQLRQCSHCIHGADLTRCAKLNIPISKYQYCGHCQHFMTDEEKQEIGKIKWYLDKYMELSNIKG